VSDKRQCLLLRYRLAGGIACGVAFREAWRACDGETVWQISNATVISASASGVSSLPAAGPRRTHCGLAVVAALLCGSALPALSQQQAQSAASSAPASAAGDTTSAAASKPAADAASASPASTGTAPANPASADQPVCFKLTAHCIDPKTGAGKTADSSSAGKPTAKKASNKPADGKPLNLSAPDVRSVVPAQELREPLPTQDQELAAQEGDTVQVAGDTDNPDVPGGFGALWWAIRNPSQAWRIVAPVQ
jgi:hypothetical protein